MLHLRHRPERAVTPDREPRLSPILRLCRVTLVALAALVPAAGYAGTIYGLTSDTEVREDGVVSEVTGSSMLPGGSGSPVLDRAAVYVFQLPDFGAVANPFTTAKFQFHVSSKSGTTPNVDLYGLGRRASSTVLASDYYGETTTADPTDATLLQNNILIPTSAIGVTSTNATGGTALINYLNAQYAAGAGAGQYVFLRFSTESTASGANRYGLTAADGGAVGSPDTRPQMIYTAAHQDLWKRDLSPDAPAPYHAWLKQ